MTPDLASYRSHLRHLLEGYESLLGEHGYEHALLSSGSPARKCVWDDQFWPLRVNPYFQHWLPLVEGDAHLLVSPGTGKPKLVRVVASDFWDGAIAQETDHFWDEFEVIEVAHREQICQQLPKSKMVLVGEPNAVVPGLDAQLVATNPKSLVVGLEQLRAKKTAYERACMRFANQRAAAGHVAVKNQFSEGKVSEFELNLTYLRATAQNATETPYQNIVALGEHAATLHHIDYDKQPNEKGSLLIDAGASYWGYQSDITRTHARGTTNGFGDLIAAMEGLQDELCKRVVVGKAFEELHNEAHDLLAKVLVDSGVCLAAPEDLVERGVTRTFFPHGLGHSLGLQTHDVGCRLTNPSDNNAALRNTSVIEAGHVLTVEPGCYFIDVLLDALRDEPAAETVDWSVVESLTPYGGIRIEDNVAAGESGPQNLTREFLPHAS